MPRPSRRIRRSSANRWSSWFVPGARQRSSRVSSTSPRRASPSWVRKPPPTAASRWPSKDVLSTAEREELARLRRENRQLKLERDILAKATAWFAGKGDKTSTGLRTREREPGQTFRCRRCAACSRSRPAATTRGWIARRRRVRSTDAVLIERIRQVHAESRRRPTACPACAPSCSTRALRVSGKRVARLMRSAAPRRQPPARLRRDHDRRDRAQRPAPDLVKREFTADGPNQLWVADMTYVPTWAGFIYLAVVLDVWSRRIVGWAIGETMTADLVLAALNMALQQRKPDGVIHHSDQGSQYTSDRLRRSAARRWACARRWARSATPTTTRWPRASSPPSSAS